MKGYRVYIIVFIYLLVSVSSGKSKEQSEKKHKMSGYVKMIAKLMVTREYPRIFPGTNWCGAGNTAEHDEDYGTFKETDMCCKQHDHCPCIILSKSKNYGLENDASYTRLHCKCDVMFLKCLKKIYKEKHVATVVGVTYFDFLRTKCFYKVPKENDESESVKCHEEDQYEWIDVPSFIANQDENEEMAENMNELMTNSIEQR